MRNKMRDHFMFLALLLLRPLSGWSADSSVPASVDVPCMVAKSPQDLPRLRKCSKELKDYWFELIKEHVIGVADCYYKHSDPARCGIVAGNVCNWVPGAAYIHSEKEDPSNSRGGKCGGWTAFKTKLIPPPIPGDPPKCQIEAIQTKPPLEAESSYIYGGYIRGLDCHLHQIREEIDAGYLVLTRAGTEPGPQSVWGGEYFKLRDRLLASPNIADTPLCREEGGAKQVISGCYLSATREHLEKSFVYLAILEILARAQASYEKYLPAVAPPGSVLQGPSIPTDVPPDQCKSSAVFEIYKERFDTTVKARLATQWSEAKCHALTRPQTGGTSQ